MIEWAWPWFGLLAPLPWLVRRLLPPLADGAGAPVRIPFLSEVEALAGHGTAVGRGLLPALLVWLLLVLAAMRPVHVGEPVAQPSSGRDLLLAVDISGSMAAEDMSYGGRRVSRMAAVKLVLADFLERRAGDRVGLLLFGQLPYLVTPLTFDLEAVRAQLIDAQVGLAGRETAIGDALGLAVKRLRERPAEQRVVILLTDGVNTAGALDPAEAAELAEAEDVRVYTIGMGTDRSERSLFGMALQGPGAQIDEAALRDIADRTGGRFFRARDTSELAGIYAELDRLESVEHDAEPMRPRQERYTWPLGAALLVLVLMLLVPSTAAAARAEARR